MANKKGIELSINFLVMIILSLVIFSFGIYFVYKIYFNLPKPPEMELPICESMEKLCLTKDTLKMETSKLALTKLYVGNMENNEETFNIVFVTDKWIDSRQVMHNEVYQVRILANKDDINILPNEKQEITIGFETETTLEKGTYIVDLNVYRSDGTLYDQTIKIYLEV
jgi:hypothetical protein